LKWDVRLLEQSFSVVTEEKPNALWTASAADMVRPETMSSFLALYRSRLKSEDGTAATYFFGYFRSVAFALQYGLSVYDRALDLSLDRLTIQLVPDNGYDRFWFVVRPLEDEIAPDAPSSREAWLGSALTVFYRDTVRPLVRTLHSLTGMSETQLWGQFPTLFQYYADMYRENAAMQPHLAAFEEDYAFLRHGLDPMEAFGRARNPFDVKPRYTESLTDPAKQTLLKSSCCLFYCTEGGDYCYSCPRLKESEREKQRIQYRSSAVNAASV
jgi:ferric iron reductase protein FhuF